MKSDNTQSRSARQQTGAGTSPVAAQTPSAQAAGASSPAATLSSATNTLAESILRAIQNVNRQGKREEVRQATRHHYCVPLTLHIDDPRARTTRTIRAASSNISNGGFAFIFDAAVTVGSTIRAQFDSLPGKPEIAGVVRSCVHICGTQHRIGVEYQ